MAKQPSLKEVLFAIAVCAALFGCSQSQKPDKFSSSFRPATSGFGQNLGAKIPDGVDVETNENNSRLTFKFKPNAPLLYFWGYQCEITSDRTICRINGFGSLPSNSLTNLTNSLIQTFTEKYGIRTHSSGREGEAYFFGTEDKFVMLGIAPGANDIFAVVVQYEDRALADKAREEMKRRKADQKN